MTEIADCILWAFILQTYTELQELFCSYGPHTLRVTVCNNMWEKSCKEPWNTEGLLYLRAMYVKGYSFKQCVTKHMDHLC